MPETHILTLRDNGREIVAAVGDTLVVGLPETPSTGFRWVVEAQGGLRPAGDRFDPGGGAPGAAGVRRFTWQAEAPGAGVLGLALRRAWDPAGSDADRFGLGVTVT